MHSVNAQCALDRGVSLCVCVRVFMSVSNTAVARVHLLEAKLLLKKLTIGDNFEKGLQT